MIAVIHHRDISCLRVDSLYTEAVLCVLKHQRDSLMGFVLDGDKSYTMISNLLLYRHREVGRKTSEKRVLKKLHEALAEGYISIHPPVMWEHGDDAFKNWLRNEDPLSVFRKEVIRETER